MQGTIAERLIFNKFDKSISKRLSPDGRINTKDSSMIGISLVVAVVLIFSSLFYVWPHVQIVNLGYEISQANIEKNELLQLNKKLKLEIATLTSPYHVEDIAKRELRLTSPKINQLVVLK
ncbi:MAG: cell division protein FtsL [Desulfobacterales bacterium]|nr:cell division protein FtsL [Desulfobacterales bacterium]